jgi:hypothetical protein
MSILKIYDVCRYLRPDGGWLTNGDDYDGIVFEECEPFTKAEYEAAIPLAQSAADKKEADEIAAKAAAEAKLEALGLTPDDLRALGL